MIDRVGRAARAARCTKCRSASSGSSMGWWTADLGFGGEESAGASFSRLDGSVWTTDKDGIVPALLSAEITARTGRDPGEHYRALTPRTGRRRSPIASTRPANARAEEKARASSTGAQVGITELAGEPIEQVLTHAPGNDAPIGGVKVISRGGWFAARPSGTEDIYKIYAESFRDDAHLRRLIARGADHRRCGARRRLTASCRHADHAALTDTAKRLLPWLVAVGFLHGIAGHDDSEYRRAGHRAGARMCRRSSMKAVLASYTLSLAVFIPISGWMANRFGTRRVFASAIGIFTLGSLLCGISSDIHLLVACRILQGCGGAMMLPVGRLTMVRAFAKSELISAMSFVAIPGLVGPMLGPLAGRPDHRILSLERDFFRQHSDRPVRSVHGLSAFAQLSREAVITRWISSDWCCSARALHCCPTCSRCSAKQP